MMPSRSYRWLLISLAIIGLTSDLVSKYRVFHWLFQDGKPVQDGKLEAWVPVTPWHADDATIINGGRYDLVPGWFGFTAEFVRRDPTPIPRVNHGALFGMGGDHKELANNVFAVISFLAAVGIISWTVLRGRQADGWMCAALGLILGGTIGNLYDRILFDGVRDFLYFYKIKWPVFNVADCCLVCGAIMLLIHAFLLTPTDKPAPSQTATTPVPTGNPQEPGKDAA